MKAPKGSERIEYIAITVHLDTLVDDLREFCNFFALAVTVPMEPPMSARFVYRPVCSKISEGDEILATLESAEGVTCGVC